MTTTGSSSGSTAAFANTTISTLVTYTDETTSTDVSTDTLIGSGNIISIDFCKYLTLNLILWFVIILLLILPYHFAIIANYTQESSVSTISNSTTIKNATVAETSSPSTTISSTSTINTTVEQGNPIFCDMHQ